MTEPPASSPRSGLLAAYVEKRSDLVRFFTARLRSVEAAEDLVQDLYLKLTRLDDPGEVQNEVGYLYRLGSNLMLDRLRRERRATVRDNAWYVSRRQADQGEELAHEAPPDEQVIAAQTLARALEIIDSLPPRTALAFRLHRFKGLTNQQIAETMGVTRSAVEKHISAALKQLVLRLR